MRKQQLTLVVLSLIIFAGCKKDGKIDSEPRNILGRWYITEVFSENNWIPVTKTCLDGMYAEFSKDFTYKSYESCDKSSYSGTYVYTNNMVTCKVAGVMVTYTIVELSGNNAVFELNETGESIKMKAVRK